MKMKETENLKTKKERVAMLCAAATESKFIKDTQYYMNCLLQELAEGTKYQRDVQEVLDNYEERVEKMLDGKSKE